MQEASPVSSELGSGFGSRRGQPSGTFTGRELIRIGSRTEGAEVLGALELARR